MSLDVYDYLSLVAEGVIGVVSAAGNGLVLYAIYRKRSLRTFTNYLIASLAAADLLVGLVGIPCVIVNYVGLPHNFYGCLFTSCMIVVATQISIFSLLAIGIERYIAIKHPLKHRQWLNGNVAIGVITVVWVAGSLVGLVPMFGWHLDEPAGSSFVCAFVVIIDMRYLVYFNFFGFFLSPLVILFLSYGYIFSVVRRRMATVAATAGRDAAASAATKDAQGQTLKRESRAAKVIFLVLVIFAACWLPIHILNAFILYNGFSNNLDPVITISVLLSHANSCLNPFVYGLTNKKFKSAFLEILHVRPRGVAPTDTAVQDTAVAHTSQHS